MDSPAGPAPGQNGVRQVLGTGYSPRGLTSCSRLMVVTSPGEPSLGTCLTLILFFLQVSH